MPILADGIVSFEDYLCGRIKGDFLLAFRKTALQGNRFNEKLRAHESLLWLRIHRKHKARYAAKVICNKYAKHGGEYLTHIDVRLGQLQYTVLALSQFIDEFGNDLIHLCPSVYGKRLAYLGLHQMAVNNFASGRSLILCSLKYRFSMKYVLFYIFSFFITEKHVINIIRWVESQ